MKKKNLIILMVLSVGLISCQNDNDNDNKKIVYEEPQSPSEYNVLRAEQLIEDMFTFIVLTEGIKGANETYLAGGKYTSAFGITYKPNGKSVSKEDHISLDTARTWAFYQLKKRVIPFFKFFDQCKLSDERILAAADIIYNAGGERVTGKRLDGKQVYETSMFFEKLQSGASDEECIACLTRFRKADGVVANGILKRRWIEGAILKGILTPSNVLDLSPVGFYNSKIGDFYLLDEKNKIIRENGFYQPDYSEYAVEMFFEKNLSDDVRVKDIV